MAYTPSSRFQTSYKGVSLDTALLDIIQTAATQFPLRVEPFSGVAARGTGTHNHPEGRAIDVRIYDANGNEIPNYVGRAIDPAKMRDNPYLQFAAAARQVQEQKYPELTDKFRAGAFFKSGVNPGDLMHFDVSGGLSKGTPPQTQEWAQLLGDTQTAAAKQGIATRQEDIASADFPMSSGQATRGGFENALVQAESNGKNVPNVTDPGPNVGGGYFQIKDPTWTAYAKKAGVDTALYPNALASPYEIQRQVASVIPLGQWGPRTLRMVQDAGYTIDKGKTFAQNVLANGEVLGGAAPVAAAGQAGYPTTTASLLFGGGANDTLLGASRAQVPAMPTAQVGGGQPLSPYVRGDFFPTPAPALQPHLTTPGGYAPTITAIQPYSTQPSPEVLAAAYGQRDASYAQPQQDIGPAVQHISGPTAPPQQYTPPPAAALPVAPSDFTLSDLMHAQSGGLGQDIFGAGQAPAAAPMPGGTPAPVQVAPVGHPVHDFLQHIVQNVVPNIPSIFQHLTGGASGPGVTGPLPAGVSSNNAVGALLGGQNWHAPSLFNSSGGINPSGGSSYNYFTPSSPGGIGGYMTSTGHIYTYPTDPDIYHSVAS